MHLENIYASNEQKTSLALSVPRYKVYVDLLTIKDQLFNDSLQTLVDSLGVLLPQRTSAEWKDKLTKERKKGNRYCFIARGLRNDQIERFKKFFNFQPREYRGGCIIINLIKGLNPMGF